MTTKSANFLSIALDRCYSLPAEFDVRTAQMAFFYWLGVLVFLYYLLSILCNILFDSDVGMIIAERFGKPIDELKGKVIWITGASSGIGEHLAISCAKAGSKLVLSARREDELERVKKICLESSSGKLKSDDVLVVPLDILELDTHQALLDRVLRHFGSLDILVNNAGRSQRANWEEIEIDVDRGIFELNVFGVVHLTRACTRYFLKRGGGHVAVTSSGAGIMGVPYSGSYTGTKHAIHGYFDSLRSEKIGNNITVTVFCPGPTFSNFLQESFTAKKDDKFGVSTSTSDKRMTGERCGHLFAVALANKVDEAWVSIQPIILLYYLNAYMPNVLKLIMKVLGPKFMLKVRDSRDSMKKK